MSQERLAALGVLSIECQVLRELDFTQLIDDFGQLKCLIGWNLLHETCVLSSVIK
ncbi:hypothetical protein DPMN_015863 [Dreissena polymorpha]|uniref:Uncharacterized protein n=1 Tax=Dreissena polymorpha TaxID=45954 RepID=A0A9D4NBU1_DREPO|nr:hypothetical protein DPMN_015863 [Dreissena polymorpha]